jgi:hypothetical protein
MLLYIVKVKVKFVHVDVMGSGGIAPPFVTSELDGGEWSASHSNPLTQK